MVAAMTAIYEADGHSAGRAAVVETPQSNGKRADMSGNEVYSELADTLSMLQREHVSLAPPREQWVVVGRDGIPRMTLSEVIARVLPAGTPQAEEPT